MLSLKAALRNNDINRVSDNINHLFTNETQLKNIN